MEVRSKALPIPGRIIWGPGPLIEVKSRYLHATQALSAGLISRSFIKSSLVYTVAGTLPVASAFILLPFYIRDLTTETFGVFSIFLAFSVLVQLLTTFSYDATLYIHYHEFKDDKATLSRYVGSALILMAMNGIVLTLFFFLTGDAMASLFFDDKNLSFYPYGYVCLITGVLQSVFRVNNSLLQTRQRPELFFWSNLLSFSLIAGFTIVGLKMFPNSLAGPLGGRMIAAIISGGWAAVRLVREFGLHFDYRLMRSSFSFNFYTFVYQLQQWIMNYFDRVLVAFFLPLSQVGIYSFAVQCMLVIEFVVNGLFSSFYPKVVAMVMDQKEKMSTVELNRYYYGLTAVVLILVSLSIVGFPFVLDLFASKSDYLQSVSLIPFIALLYIFKAMRMYFSIPYGILKYTKPLPAIYLSISGLKVLGMVVLIGPMGIYGVILAGLISLLAEIGLLFRFGSPKFSFRFNVFKLIWLPVAMAVLIAIAEPLFASAYPLAVHLGYVGACGILLFWIYRNEVKLITPSKIFGKS